MKTINKKYFLFVLAVGALLVTACSNKSSQPSESIYGMSSASTPIPTPIYSWIDKLPGEGEEITVDPADFTLDDNPYGLNVTYYNGIFSRGFAYITNEETTGTELYVVKSELGEQADFSTASKIEGRCDLVTMDGKKITMSSDEKVGEKSKSCDKMNFNSHKAHVENLEKDTVYSYKIGSNGKYAYGVFKTEVEAPTSIRAIEMSDAQTKDYSKIGVFRNTFKQARLTAGNDLDMVLYGGDLFDQNMSGPNGQSIAKTLRYGKAINSIKDWKTSVPFMTAAGNHEPSFVFGQYIMNDINYGGIDDEGCYYSYDYGFAHFTVIDTNNISKEDQVNWIKSDLEAHQDSKWRIVLMHAGCYTTGDHGSKSDNESTTKTLAPVFSQYHVDLALEAHDHTYSKTLPYKWDAAGYVKKDEATEETIAAVVNKEVETETVNEVTYDKNPEGTYYVITGAAGHRCGASEAEDAGIYAEVVKNESGEWAPADSQQTFMNYKYKMELGTLTEETQFEPYTAKNKAGQTVNFAQQYHAGDLATANPNAQMFGVLDLTETTLTYKAYAVNDAKVQLFDQLNVLKA